MSYLNGMGVYDTALHLVVKLFAVLLMTFLASLAFPDLFREDGGRTISDKAFVFLYCTLLNWITDTIKHYFLGEDTKNRKGGGWKGKVSYFVSSLKDMLPAVLVVWVLFISICFLVILGNDEDMSDNLRVSLFGYLLPFVRMTIMEVTCSLIRKEYKRDDPADTAKLLAQTMASVELVFNLAIVVAMYNTSDDLFIFMNLLVPGELAEQVGATVFHTEYVQMRVYEVKKFGRNLLKCFGTGDKKVTPDPEGGEEGTKIIGGAEIVANEEEICEDEEKSRRAKKDKEGDIENGGNGVEHQLSLPSGDRLRLSVPRLSLRRTSLGGNLAVKKKLENLSPIVVGKQFAEHICIIVGAIVVLRLVQEYFMYSHDSSIEELMDSGSASASDDGSGHAFEGRFTGFEVGRCLLIAECLSYFLSVGGIFINIRKGNNIDHTVLTLDASSGIAGGFGISAFLHLLAVGYY